MKRFIVEKTDIAGVNILTRQKMEDERGFLSRLFCTDELTEIGWQGEIAQINETMTLRQGTVRGMHFQREPSAEIKIVSCINGQIFDVAIDLREKSPTYLQSFSCELSEENNKSLLIPVGCAHGFQALTDNVRLIYFHSAAYNADVEDGINVLDQRININWPLKPINSSDRDASLPTIGSDFKGIAI